MRKIILGFAAIVISAGTYAQTDSLNRRMNHDMNSNQHQNMQNKSVGDKSCPDGVMMQNGKMMKVKNGQTTMLQDNDMSMSNGTKIMSDGTCIHKDGTKTTMKEGQHMDMSGNLNARDTNNDKKMYLVPNNKKNEIK